MIRREEKTCYDCKYCILITEKDKFLPGDTEHTDYECVNSKIKYSFLEKNDFDYENMAKRCDEFEKRTVTINCSNCGKKFKFNQPNWPYWVKKQDGYEVVCSQECREDMNKAFQNENKTNTAEDSDSITLKKIRYNDRPGIKISNIDKKISTTTNSGFYFSCKMAAGKPEDDFDIWGKFKGRLKNSRKGTDKAYFEFYVKNGDYEITYWKKYKYRKKAEKLAEYAVNLFQEIQADKNYQIA